MFFKRVMLFVYKFLTPNTTFFEHKYTQQFFYEIKFDALLF